MIQLATKHPRNWKSSQRQRSLLPLDFYFSFIREKHRRDKCTPNASTNVCLRPADSENFTRELHPAAGAIQSRARASGKSLGERHFDSVKIQQWRVEGVLFTCILIATVIAICDGSLTMPSEAELETGAFSLNRDVSNYRAKYLDVKLDRALLDPTCAHRLITHRKGSGARQRSFRQDNSFVISAISLHNIMLFLSCSAQKFSSALSSCTTERLR